jgi:hypothetical protein
VRRQASFAVLALALVAIGAVAGVALRRHALVAAPSASAPSTAAAPLPDTPPVASEPPQFPHAIRYACAELAPRAEGANADETSPAGVLRKEARWYGVSALDCADGLVLDQSAYGRTLSTVTALLSAAPKDLSVLGRALTQNAAMRIARCARSKEVQGAPAVSPVAIEELRRSSLRLVQRLALSESELATLKELVRPAAEKWLGPGYEERAVDGPRDSVGIHARASALTLASRALPNDADGVATLYGDLVLMNDRGVARTAGVPAYVIRRRTLESGLAICFGALSEDEKTGVAEERPIDLPEGPYEMRGVTCDRCHIAGRRLSEPVSQPRSRSDGALLENVTRWYTDASERNQKR